MTSVRALCALAVVMTTGLGVLPATASAEESVATLPAVTQQLDAASAQARDCRVDATGQGIDSATWTAPMSGYVTARLNAPANSDWDAALFDVASGQLLGSSAAFRSQEVVQGWVQSGQKLRLQGCRRTGPAQAATSSFTLTDIKPPAGAPRASLLNVRFNGESGFHKLERLGFDVTHRVGANNADVIVAGDKQRQVLDRQGFAHDTLIADLGKHYMESREADARFALAGGASLPSGDRATYRTYDEIQQELKALTEQFPGHVKPMTLPQQSFQGRPLDGVEIASDVNADDGRPVFLLVSLHHAREWPSAEASMEFAWMLAKGYGQDDADHQAARARARGDRAADQPRRLRELAQRARPRRPDLRARREPEPRQPHARPEPGRARPADRLRGGRVPRRRRL